MSLEITLSVADIAKELNAGKATIKFLLKRFHQWLPFKLIDGLPLYPHNTLQKIILIQENLETGFSAIVKPPNYVHGIKKIFYYYA